MSERLKCANCPAWADELHHIVYQQHVRRAGGDLGDRRNFLPLCHRCHGQHHAISPLPRHLIPAEAYEFAEELGLAHKIERHYPEAESEAA